MTDLGNFVVFSIVFSVLAISLVNMWYEVNEVEND